jgi:hypothetical protein
MVARIAGDPPAPDAPISQLPLIAEFKRPKNPLGNHFHDRKTQPKYEIVKQDPLIMGTK